MTFSWPLRLQGWSKGVTRAQCSLRSSQERSSPRHLRLEIDIWEAGPFGCCIGGTWQFASSWSVPLRPQKLDSRIIYWRTSQAPLQDIASVFNVMVEEIKEPHYDDPTLALLFSQLRMKTLQAAKGTSEISGRSEFKFILQIAKVFCRMGECLSLASRGVGAQVKPPFRVPCSCTRPCPILVIRPAIDYCPFPPSLTLKWCHQLYLSSPAIPT